MLDDANGAAPDAAAASDVAPVTTAPEPAPAPQAEAPRTIRDTMAAVLAKYPDRATDGRFESRNPRPEIATDAAPAEAAPVADATTDQPAIPAAETAPAPSIEPPASWSADVRAKWATLSPDLQAYIARRESEAHQAITEKGSKLKGYEQLDSILEPRRQAIRATYGDEATGIRQLFELSDFATKDPAGFVRWFAEQRGIDLSRLTSAPAQMHAAPPQADPQVATLERELHTVKQTIAQQQAAQMDADIRRFAEAKGEDGNPLRPYFNDVRTEMGRLISAGIAETLEDAYTKAIRTNDAVWAKVQADDAAKRAKAEAERQAKEREAAAKAAREAQRAASVNVRATGAVSGSPTRSASMRETMEAVAKRYASGA